MTFVRLAALGALALGTMGCGTLGRASRGEVPTYTDARGGAPASSMFSLDLPVEDRLILKVAMDREVVLAHVEPSGRIHLLTECGVGGGYERQSTPPERDVLVRADSWAGGVGVGGVGAGASGGEALVAAVQATGRAFARRADGMPRLAVTSGEVGGRCPGATHFVSTAVLGGFERTGSTSGSVGASANLFGIGANGQSASGVFVRGAGDYTPLRVDLTPIARQPLVQLRLVRFRVEWSGVDGQPFDGSSAPDPYFQLRRDGMPIWTSPEYEDSASGAPGIEMGRPIPLTGSDSLTLWAFDEDAPFAREPMGHAELSILDAVMGREVEVVLRQDAVLRGRPVELGRVWVRFERLE